MAYRIEFVQDAEMPDGHDYLLVPGDAVCVFFFRESFRDLPLGDMGRLMEEAWAAFRMLGEARGIPMQRVCSESAAQKADAFGAAWVSP